MATTIHTKSQLGVETVRPKEKNWQGHSLCVETLHSITKNKATWTIKAFLSLVSQRRKEKEEWITKIKRDPGPNFKINTAHQNLLRVLYP